MAFGIKVGGQTFFTVFALLASAVIFIYILKARTEKIQLRIALALILGGAIGNLIDRFLYGKVIDFVEVEVANAHWPIFNLADAAVTVGTALLLVFVVFDRQDARKHEAGVPSD